MKQANLTLKTGFISDINFGVSLRLLHIRHHALPRILGQQ